MFDKLLFKAQFNTGQTIRLNTAEGVILDSCDANIGVLQGKARTIPAILCDGASDTDQWKILNIVNKQGMFLDHVAIKGAVSDDQAHRLCQKYLTQARQGRIRNQVELTVNGVKTFLDCAKLPNTSPYIIQSDAALLDAQGTVNAVIWGEDNQLLSHGGRLSQAMFDMAGCDIQGNLLEQVTPRDVVAMLLDDTCEVVGGMFDAIVIKYAKLEQVTQKIAEALKASDNEEFFVKSVTPIEPFKRQGVVNVGAIFEMSDSQTITVLFNNPDTTPSKLTGTDVLTSWKWILNKRDVTAILQPRAVDARKYPQIANRMMKVLATNHDRFKRAQAAKNKDELLLAELVGQVEASQLELRRLDQSTIDVQKQIDAETTRKQQETEAIAVTQKAEADAASKAEVITKFKAVIKILTKQHDFEVLQDNKKDNALLNELFVILGDKNERDVNFHVTEGQQGAGLEYKITSGSYGIAWDINDSAEQTAKIILEASLEFDKTLHADDAAEAAAAQADEVTDPTKPEDYAKIQDDEAQLIAWQDRLDAFFQNRLGDIRIALRELEWTGEVGQELSKNDHRLKVELKQVGGGANVVAVTYSIPVLDFVYRDDLKLSPQEVAYRIDQALPEAEPKSLDEKKAEYKKFLAELAGWMSETQLGFFAENINSEDFDALYDQVLAVHQTMEGMPAVGSTDGQGKDAIALLHYFTGNSHWYVTEANHRVFEGDTVEAFGYASLNGFELEAGYMNIGEIITHAELDLHFEQVSIKEIQRSGSNTNNRAKSAILVDAAYPFDDASDLFKEFVSDSIELEDYSPFLSAKTIDQAVKEKGGSVSWGDGVADGGTIKKDGVIIARADIGGDGKSMIYQGAEADKRVGADQGENFMYTEDPATLKSMVNVLFAQTNEQSVQINNENEQFLNDIIAGSVDLLADETGDRLEKIGENLDESLTDLFNQVVDAYTVAAMNNAKSIN